MLLGVFAKSPTWFAHSGHITHHGNRTKAFELTNRGLRVALPLYDNFAQASTCTAVLTDCHSETDLGNLVGILLWPSVAAVRKDHAYRWNGFPSSPEGTPPPHVINAASFEASSNETGLVTFYIALTSAYADNILASMGKTMSSICTFTIEHYSSQLFSEMDRRLFFRLPPFGHWSPESNTFDYSDAFVRRKTDSPAVQLKIHAKLYYNHGLDAIPIATVAIHPPPKPGYPERFGLFHPGKKPRTKGTAWPRTLHFAIDDYNNSGQAQEFSVTISMKSFTTMDEIRSDYVLFIKRYSKKRSMPVALPEGRLATASPGSRVAASPDSFADFDDERGDSDQESLSDAEVTGRQLRRFMSRTAL
jgi:hypothetical protein